MSDETPDAVLTLAEAAEEVKLHEQTLGKAAREGRGPFYKVEGRWRCYRSELHAWVRSHGPKQRRSGDELDPMPMPSPRPVRRKKGGLREEVERLRGERA